MKFKRWKQWRVIFSKRGYYVYTPFLVFLFSDWEKSFNMYGYERYFIFGIWPNWNKLNNGDIIQFKWKFESKREFRNCENINRRQYTY